MKIELPEAYYEFGDSVAGYLDRNWAARDLRTYWDGGSQNHRALWDPLAELGVFALTVPTSVGGEGLPLLATVPILEQIGRRGLPHPIAETVAVVTPALASISDDAATAALKAIMQGAMLATVQDGWDGYAPWGADVDLVLVLDGDDTVHLCGPASPDSRVSSVDPSRRLAQARSEQVRETYTSPRIAAQARLRATAATAIALGGAGLKVIELSVAYAKVRSQFGQIIGSFQALKHLLANAYFAVETNRRLGWLALSVADADAENAAQMVSSAKYLLGEAAQEASYAGLQVHGGIGYTWECDLHFWLKRIQVLNSVFGTPDLHVTQLATMHREGAAGGLTGV
jgi:alkylation response protein AidB-like acyl-CoA dehydrogenase